ncbi:hypothetical protein MRX96_050675 [Rhipicephalus microplus]
MLDSVDWLDGKRGASRDKVNALRYSARVLCGFWYCPAPSSVTRKSTGSSGHRFVEAACSIAALCMNCRLCVAPSLCALPNLLVRSCLGLPGFPCDRLLLYVDPECAAL